MTKQNLLEQYKELLVKNKLKSLSLGEVIKKGISRNKIRHHFGDYTNLKAAVKETYPELFEDIVDETDFTEKNFRELKKEIKNYKKFVITTAVAGCDVDEKFFKSLKNYCKKNSAKLLVLPVADPAKTGSWDMDPKLKDESFVFKDLKLNSNFFISTIKMSAKQIQPLTGLSRIGQRSTSFVFGSPKQDLEVVPVSNQKLAHVLMSTGAVTKPDYRTDRYMSKRTEYIAQHDHIVGGIVVEIENNKIYHYRQVQADSKGGLVDLGVYYSPDGKKSHLAPEAMVIGDRHVGDTDPTADKAWYEIAKYTKCPRFIEHDFFNGSSISHHETHKKITKAQKAEKGKINLEKELYLTAKKAHELTQNLDELVIVKSNHDEWLNRYLEECRFIEDPENKRISHKLSLAMLEGKDPLQYYVEELSGFDFSGKIKWLDRDEDYYVAGFQCGAHGDLGPNGSSGSLAGLEKAYGQGVFGHTHTAAIRRLVIRVGTSTKLKLSYNRGASSWSHTIALIYPNGCRQLVNSIEGKWRLK